MAFVLGPRVVAIVSVLGGCTDPADVPVPTVEVGTGIDAWEELISGDEIYLVEGAQGGRHVIGNVRMAGMDPGTTRATAPATRFDMFRVDGTRLSADIPPFSQPFVETPDGGLTLPFGRFVYVEVPAAEILDTMVEIKVIVTDLDGNSAQDGRLVLVKPYVYEGNN